MLTVWESREAWERRPESRCINAFAGCMCEDLSLVMVLEELEDRLDARDKVIPHDSGDA